ncbi:alpha/beta fold hydrolase [Fictibacillus phosphorivorans]|uniref:alpha/beta fold hydrolase n=1 Tax=Fictibacillus phosphorivorans TaxID=1221500 RepID=UPI0035E8B44A
MALAGLTSELQIYYEKLGTGAPIVFLHPPGMSHLVFKYQRELATDYQTIFPDCRGHGRSSIKDKETFTIWDLADDVASLLDHLLLEEAYICGYSAGGSVAQAFVQKYPHRTKGLILSGGFSRVSTFALKKQFQTGIRLAKNAPALLNQILVSTHSNSPEDRKEMLSYHKQTDPKTCQRFYQESLSFQCTDQLKEWRFPLLFIYGEQAEYMHPYRRIYARNVHPKAKFVLLNKALHQLPIKHYVSFNAEIKKFIPCLT